MRTVVVLGSTGSVGTQALQVVAANPGRFRVVGLAAGGADPDLLARQAVEHRVSRVAIADPGAARLVREAWDRHGGSGRLELLTGVEAAGELAGRGADVVLNAITGSVGLHPTLAALDAGSTLALANKESLVVGGVLVTGARRRPDQIVPVDSEHSAIWQCLQAADRSQVRRLVLTASGGPFRGWTRDELARVTPKQALAHPTWSMGPVVTVNSATLMNKALELAEAHLLFDVPADDVAVVVHPQSVVHSMVELVDGSTLLQASPPDMRLPIALGLSWPDRLAAVAPACDWSTAATWSFEPLDESVFGAVRLIRHAVVASATHPAVVNAANEECVDAFLDGRLPFPAILGTVERVLDEHDGVPAERVTLADVLGAEEWARHRARQLIGAAVPGV